MLRLKCPEKGMMLITILMLLFLLVMLTVSMISLTSETLNLAGSLDRKARATQSAEAGIDYAFYKLNNDSTWIPAYGVPERLDNDQYFEFSYALNNLRGNTQVGTTPAYSAEIVCDGYYKEYKQKIRAVFVREDNIPCGIISQGSIRLHCYRPFEYYTEKTPGIEGAVQGHSNSSIKLICPFGLDLHDGFMSACSIVNNLFTSYPIKEKEGVSPEKIPDIDIADIINNKDPNDPNYVVILPDDTFYLAGFFEYNSSVPYCIAHSTMDTFPQDQTVFSYPYKAGIAILSTEDDCLDFLENYGKTYHGFSRNLYDSYSVDFREYPLAGPPSAITTFNNNLVNDTGMSMSFDPSINEITLTLEKDIYVNTVNGLFATEYVYHGGFGAMGDYIPLAMHNSSVKMDFNNHIIFGNKLFLGIPPVGTGAIVSRETIDTVSNYTSNLALLSEKSVRVVIRDTVYSNPVNFFSTSTGMSNFNGIIYAKDNILIQVNAENGTSQPAWKIKGVMASKDIVYNNNNESSPFSGYQSFDPDESLYSINLRTSGSSSTHVVEIVHSYDGLDLMASLRENNFKVRKQYCEILN